MLNVNNFGGERTFISGNRCERPLGKQAKIGSEQGYDLYQYKYERTFAYKSLPYDVAPRGMVGLVRALNTYENYPFWHTFFTRLGYSVVLSPKSNRKVYEKGLESMPSESVCYPAKLVHGHVMELLNVGVNFIFYPSIVYEKKEYEGAQNCYNCPIVVSYPEVIRTNMEELEADAIDFRNPFLNFNHPKSVMAELSKMFDDIPAEQVKDAVQAGFAEMDTYKADIRKKGEEILRRVEASGKYGIILAGRPYHIDPEINHGIPKMIADFGITVFTEDSLSHLANAHENGTLNVLDQWMYHSRLYAAATFTTKNPNLELVQLNSFGCGLDAVTTDEVQEILESAEKIYTCLKIDEINNLGSARIRIRSLIAALEERKKRGITAKTPAPRPPRVLFTKLMKREHTVLAPQMAPMHFELLETAFNLSGYNVVMMPAIDKEAVDLGLRYVNNDTCYPAIIVVGQLLKALQSGDYDLNKVSVVMTQTGGGCRASNYMGLIRRAFRKAGLGHIPAIAASATGLEKHLGWKYYLKIAKNAVKALILGDLLMRILFATRPYEAVAGSANAMYDKWMAASKEHLAGKGSYKALCKAIIADFDQLELLGIEKPKVGVVGEILVKFHPTANNDIVTLLEAEGCEAVVPDLLDFFLYSFYGANFRHDHLGGSRRAKVVSNIINETLEFSRKHMVEALDKSQRFYPPKHIDHLAHMAKQYLSLGNQSGEGWFLTAEMVELLEHDVPNIICTQPFACLPNHVTGKGMIKELKKWYPQANIVPIDYDPGASEVNQLNRIKLMLAAARK